MKALLISVILFVTLVFDTSCATDQDDEKDDGSFNELAVSEGHNIIPGGGIIPGGIDVGISSVSGVSTDILEKLINNLDLLPDLELTLVSLEGVTELIVQGTLYTFTGIFKDENSILSKNVITVWDRPWLDAPENLILKLVSTEKIPEELPEEPTEDASNLNTPLEELEYKEPEDEVVEPVDVTQDKVDDPPVAMPGGGGNIGMPGGVSEITADTIVIDKLKSNLYKIPDTRLTLIKVTKLTQQVVAGILYVFTGIFVDENEAISRCDISIWERQWMPEPNNLIIDLVSKRTLKRRPKCVTV